MSNEEKDSSKNNGITCDGSLRSSSNKYQREDLDILMYKKVLKSLRTGD